MRNQIIGQQFRADLQAGKPIILVEEGISILKTFELLQMHGVNAEHNLLVLPTGPGNGRLWVRNGTNPAAVINKLFADCGINTGIISGQSLNNRNGLAKGCVQQFIQFLCESTDISIVLSANVYPAYREELLYLER